MSKLIVAICVICSVAACKKDKNPLTWNANQYLPVAHGEIGVADVLADTLVAVDQDSVLHFTLNQNLYTLNLDSLISIPDTSIKDTFAIPFTVPVTIAPGQVFINQPQENRLSVTDVELKNIHIKDAVISYTVESTIPADVIYTYIIPTAVDANGNTFQKDVFVPAAGSSNSVVSGSFSIVGYDVNLQGVNGNDVNILQTTINAKVDENNPSNVTVSNLDTLYVQNSIESIQIAYADGYFGSSTVVFGPETIPFDAFYSIVSGGIDLSSIDATFTATNGIGVDLAFQLDDLTASSNSTSLSFQNAMIGQVQHINRAYLSTGTNVPGIYQTSFDVSNSNIDYLVELLPDELSYSGQISINPLGNVSGGNDFIDEKNPLKVDLDMDIPLQIGLNSIVFQDSIDIIDTTLNNLNSLSLHLDLENLFPFTTQLNLGLMDQNNMIVEEIMLNNTIPPATYQADMKHTNPISSFHEIELSPYQIQLLKENPTIVLKLTLDSDATQVYIYDFYTLKYKVDAYFNHQITSGN